MSSVLFSWRCLTLWYATRWLHTRLICGRSHPFLETVSTAPARVRGLKQVVDEQAEELKRKVEGARGSDSDASTQVGLEGSLLFYKASRSSVGLGALR